MSGEPNHVVNFWLAAHGSKLSAPPRRTRNGPSFFVYFILPCRSAVLNLTIHSPKRRRAS